MLLVGLAEGVAQPPQRGPLEVGRVDDEAAARLSSPGRAPRRRPRRRARARACPPPPRGRTSASGKGSRSPRTRWTSASTSERIEATASSVRSPEAHAPAAARAAAGSRPRCRSRGRGSAGPRWGPSIDAISASFRCFRTERRNSATAQSRDVAGSATALQPQDDGGAERAASARAPSAAPSRARARPAEPEPAVERHREQKLRPRPVGAKPRCGEGRLDLPVVRRRVKGRVSSSTPFFRPKKSPETAFTLRRVG